METIILLRKVESIVLKINDVTFYSSKIDASSLSDRELKLLSQNGLKLMVRQLTC